MSQSRPGRAVVCRVGSRKFDVALDQVREVCTDVAIVRMPGVAAPIEGVANVRGSVITVVRAGDLLGVAPDSSGPSPWLVVLCARDGQVALGVDEVLDLTPPGQAVTPMAFEPQVASLFGAG
jgi:chemotaxis signal transduction protein